MMSAVYWLAHATVSRQLQYLGTVTIWKAKPKSCSRQSAQSSGGTDLTAGADQNHLPKCDRLNTLPKARWFPVE